MEKRKAIFFVAIAVALLAMAVSMGCVESLNEEEEVVEAIGDDVETIEEVIEIEVEEEIEEGAEKVEEL